MLGGWFAGIASCGGFVNQSRKRIDWEGEAPAERELVTIVHLVRLGRSLALPFRIAKQQVALCSVARSNTDG